MAIFKDGNMPLYDYKCGHCHYEREEIIDFNQSKEILVCPRCGAMRYVRQISIPHLGSTEPQFGAIINGKVVPGSFEK